MDTQQQDRRRQRDKTRTTLDLSCSTEHGVPPAPEQWLQFQSWCTHPPLEKLNCLISKELLFTLRHESPECCQSMKRKHCSGQHCLHTLHTGHLNIIPQLCALGKGSSIIINSSLKFARSGYVCLSVEGNFNLCRINDNYWPISLDCLNFCGRGVTDGNLVNIDTCVKF